MRKGITSGGRRESEQCVWGSPSLIQEKSFWVERQGTPLASSQQGFPLAFRGHWVPGFGPAGLGTLSPGTECFQAACWSSFADCGSSGAATSQADRM